MTTLKSVRIRSISATFVAAALLAAPVHAATIVGVTIEDFSTELTANQFNRVAVDVINGNGFEPNGPGTHSNLPEDTMWLTNGTFRSPNDLFGTHPNSFIEFDLEDNYNLESSTVWNYNEVNLTNRGIRDVTISVASSVGGPFTPLGNFVFNQAPGNTVTNFGQLVDLSSFAAADNVRLIRFDAISNHGGGNQFVGLSEVRFDGIVVPEPSVISLMCLGLSALIVRRRRRV